MIWHRYYVSLTVWRVLLNDRWYRSSDLCTFSMLIIDASMNALPYMYCCLRVMGFSFMFTIMMHVCYSHITYFVYDAIEYCLLRSLVCILIFMYPFFPSFSAACLLCVLLSAVPFRSTRAVRRVRADHDTRVADSIDISRYSSASRLPLRTILWTSTPGHRNCATLGSYEHFYRHARTCTHNSLFMLFAIVMTLLACSRSDGLTYTHALVTHRISSSYSSLPFPFAEDRDVFVFTPHPYGPRSSIAHEVSSALLTISKTDAHGISGIRH